MNIADNGNHEICTAVKDKYYIETLGRLKTYWKSFPLLGDGYFGAFERDFYKRLGETNPWFGDISMWWDSIKSETDPRVFEEFPISISGKQSSGGRYENELKSIGIELDYLIPNEDLMKQFLPVLITCYIFNRRKNNLFVKQIYECDEESWNSAIRHGTQSFIAEPMRKRYSKLSADAISLKDTKRSRAVYLNIIQFFVCLKNLSDTCNVSLSFYTFEAISQYIGLLGNRAIDLICEFEGKDPADILCKDKFLDEKIMEYVKLVLEDFSDLKIPHKQDSSKGTSLRAQYPPSFLQFLIGLRDELSPNICDEEDHNAVLRWQDCEDPIDMISFFYSRGNSTIGNEDNDDKGIFDYVYEILTKDEHDQKMLEEKIDESSTSDQS